MTADLGCLALKLYGEAADALRRNGLPESEVERLAIGMTGQALSDRTGVRHSPTRVARLIAEEVLPDLPLGVVVERIRACLPEPGGLRC
ncbi:MAG TPA: hypothetical protein VEY95_17880 [Azospirillaceae bacterium]|nr:hypothetical protein [Azospirillaceae bacterium]